MLFHLWSVWPAPAACKLRARPQGLRKLLATLIVGVAIVLAFVLPGYQLFRATSAIAYAIAVLGLNLLTGYNGQISLGHGAFYAIGGYTTAILMADFAVPYWLTVPVSAALCGCFGFLLGFPALRLGGVYLALTTFATAVAVPQILKSSYLEGWTGGVQGIVISKPDPPFDLPLTADQWLYLFSLALALALFLVAYNLVTGRTGRALIAIRDHALAAEAMGVNTALLKTGVFAVSALYTGIAGSLGAIAVEFVSPDSFTVLLSIVLFVGLVAGGIASILGPVFGGLFIVFVPAVAERISKAAPDAVYGLILIGFMYLMPFGIAGVVESLILRISASEGGGE